MGREKRREARRDVRLPAKVRNATGIARRAVVTDLSASGCRMYSKGARLGPNSFFTLTLDRMGFLDSTVRWSQGAFYGVKFSQQLYPPVVEHLCESFPAPAEVPEDC